MLGLEALDAVTMSRFFRTSKLWVVEFRYQGRPRRWFKALAEGVDARSEMRELLAGLYGDRARLESVREATPDEEGDYLRGEVPVNAYCPTDRR